MSKVVPAARPAGGPKESVGAHTDATGAAPAWLIPVLWAGVIGVAAVLRFYQIGASSLWSDEGNTWALIQRPFAAIVRAAAADIHPPLYYMLLRGWSLLFGTSATALRSFSALCGVALVLVTGLVASHTGNAGAARRWWALVAALWVALNPFQVYYSQEARMYMLLALEAGLLLWLLLRMMAADAGGGGGGRWGLWIGYVLVAAAGLWTHYSFPIVLGAAALGYLIDWLRRRRQGRARGADLMRFVALNLAALLLFASWLPTAWRQVSTWPQGGEAISVAEGLTLALRTLLFGPIRSAPDPAWGWVLLAAALPVAGVVALRRARGVWAVTIALAAPVALMFVLGLFSEAFLKFLLVASAPWCLLIAATAEIGAVRAVTPWLRLALAALAATLATVTLPGYYADPAARDNYQGIAAYVKAMGDPQRDVVLLDAPGQQEAWSYYDAGLPVLALPAQRPPDREATVAALERALAGKRAAYALFWATDEADPEGFVEGWLNANWHKGLESWQGNVRLVEYLAPDDLACKAQDERFGAAIHLLAACLPQPRTVESGKPVGVQLEWTTDAPIAGNLKVSLQMVDAQGQVVAQHDAEPAGGGRPTTSWLPGETIDDRHALFIPVGSAPDVYELNVVVYDPATGQRLATAAGDSLTLGSVDVDAAERWPPAEVLPIQHRLPRETRPVQFLGYNAYKQGFAHAPKTPLVPGDTLHVTLYWQVPDPIPHSWPQDPQFTFSLGGESLTASLDANNVAGRAWQPGEIVRRDFDIAYDGARWGNLAFGDESVSIGPLPR